VRSQNLRALVMQSSAPAPGAPSPWDSGLGAIEDTISQCTFLQMVIPDIIAIFWYRLHTLVATGGPIFCFVVSLKSIMTVVKSVSDGLRD
jgi:hypothetical protein